MSLTSLRQTVPASALSIVGAIGSRGTERRIFGSHSKFRKTPVAKVILPDRANVPAGCSTDKDVFESGKVLHVAGQFGFGN
jgi:hypothetical protein